MQCNAMTDSQADESKGGTATQNISIKAKRRRSGDVSDDIGNTIGSHK